MPRLVFPESKFKIHILNGLVTPILLSCLVACGGMQRQPQPAVSGLVINEVVSKNEGVWVDELGETDDYVEIFNGSTESVNLTDYLLSDDSGSYNLPAEVLAST